MIYKGSPKQRLKVKLFLNGVQAHVTDRPMRLHVNAAAEASMSYLPGHDGSEAWLERHGPVGVEELAPSLQSGLHLFEHGIWRNGPGQATKRKGKMTPQRSFIFKVVVPHRETNHHKQESRKSTGFSFLQARSRSKN